MQKESYLISTNLELGHFKNKKNILAGNWCYSENNRKINNNNIVVKDIWNDSEVFKSDYEYVKRLLKKYIISLANYLNLVHNVKFSVKFWTILTLPWLTIYLPAIYYRWKIVKKVLKKKEKIYFLDLKNLQTRSTPYDTYDFHKKIQNCQIFNYFIFRKIIFFLKKKNKVYIKKKTYEVKKKDLKKRKKSNQILFFLKIIMNILLFRLFNLNKIFLEQSIFRKIDNVKISIKLKQVPTFLYDPFNSAFGLKSFYEKKKIDYKKRNSVKFNHNYKTDFEKFLNSTIIDEIPLCFVEGFNNLYVYAKKIPMKPKKIISSYYHYFNELFKVWVAFLKENKLTKFFTVTHGGGGHMKYPSCLDFEREIADKKIVWHKPNVTKEIQLPASKFITKKNNKKKKHYICFVEGPTHLFPSRLGFATIGNENTNSFEEFLKFYKKINIKDKKKILYLPKKEHDINASKNLENFIQKDQIKESNSFNHYGKSSKLNIISYPQTTFCESILKTPTILIYKKNKWEFNKKFHFIYKKLINHKILFHDPVKAAHHVNKISKNIDTWWMQKRVQRTVNEFLNDISLVSKNSIKVWTRKLKAL